MPKKWRQHLERWMTRQMELPQDVTMDLARITMVGHIHIYIENHKGLLAFSDKEIRILLKHNQLIIRGEDLVIKAILPEEIIVEGKIDQVLYIDQ
ncbi:MULTISPECIES: sporulation protein YqfC [Priestia]|uniref:Sporulation protein YqfC n=3 Tax=Priestia TaxID=2800373 RepID=A0A0H4KMV2_9BACI|nr:MULTISPECIES: sporulation protein YqfC [Priestia]AKO94186.1 sporulation protein YqfC [Priestia filamentosa]KAB2493548.1 sporulation protein YqfC [Priestia endophytica]KYG36119.1 sporulation protein YqfC [Priestia endophytica]MBG9815059.1 sporulation protein YqfC [Priestia endophytica]MCM3539657.1 sporulation protein YqfC [Priestia endophytica]